MVRCLPQGKHGHIILLDWMDRSEREMREGRCHGLERDKGAGR
jgi:hypothetical protein